MWWEVTMDYRDGGPVEVSYCTSEEARVLILSWEGVSGAPVFSQRRISLLAYLAKRNSLPAMAV